MRKLFVWTFALLMLLGVPLQTVVASGAATADAQSRIIRIGSKAFNENRILAWLVYHTLTEAGYRVFFQENDATTFELREMLASGEIDAYVEYTGTGVLHLNEQFGDLVDFNAGYDPVTAYATVSTFDAVNNDLLWLPPAPGNNTYALAVMEDFAAANDLYTLPDLVAYVNAGNPVKLVGGSEFCERADGLEAFYRTYNFTLTVDQLTCIPNGTPTDTLAALQQGQDGANVGMAYGTAGELLIGDFVLLEDTDGAQFVYQPSAVFRGEVMRANPEILTLLRPVFAELTNRALQDLNLAVAEFGDTPSVAARSYLIDGNLVEETAEDIAEAPSCEVQRPEDSAVSANIRGTPSLDGEIIGVMAPSVRLPVDGQQVDAEGFVWWQVRLAGGAWVREDTVDELGDCQNVPPL